MPDTDHEDPVEEGWQESETCEINACSIPPSFLQLTERAVPREL